MILFGLILTLVAYYVSIKTKRITFLKKIPPIIFAGTAIIIILKGLNINYSTYNQSASFLTFLLGPATIALAYPLIKNIEVLTKNKRAIWAGLTFATLLAIMSTITIGKMLHMNLNIIISMIPKSVTTPIAVEISKSLGGIPELTACVVILTGIVGGLLGHRVLNLFKIKHDISIGLSIGATSHVLGTARCIEKKKEKQAAISTLALIMVGFFTALVTPILVKFLFTY